MILEFLLLAGPSIAVAVVFLVAILRGRRPIRSNCKTRDSCLDPVVVERLSYVPLHVRLRELSNPDKTVEEMRLKVEETLRKMKKLKTQP